MTGRRSSAAASGETPQRLAIRSPQARFIAATMVVVILLGFVAAALLVNHRETPPDDSAVPQVISEARQLAVANVAYDDSALVDGEALRIAALAHLSVDQLPAFLQYNPEEYKPLQTMSRADLISALEAQDTIGKQGFDTLLATPGYTPTDAVRVTLGPLTSEKLQAYRDNGATAADLDSYRSASSEFGALQRARDPAQAKLLKSIQTLESAPRPNEVPALNWGGLAAIAIAVLALESALAYRLTQLVGAGDAAVATEADRRREQVVSMFLVARRLTMARPGAAIAATVAEEASWTIDADFAFVTLVDGTRLVPVASYGDVSVASIASSSGLLGRCADTVATQHETVPSDPVLPDERGPLTLIAAPVLVRQRVAGVLTAGRRSAERFGADDETALTLLAHVTGGALENQQPDPASRAEFRVALAKTGTRKTADGSATPAPTVTSADVATTATASTATAPTATANDVSMGASFRVSGGGANDSIPAGLTSVSNWVRALVPDLEVRRADTAMKLPGASARLLAVLIAQRQPVTVDKLADLLWPEIDITAGRNRLNVTVHRLRKALELPADEFLVRSSDGMALVPGSNWFIDSWHFWELSGAERDLDDQAIAYDLYRGGFCARQFAYEDAVGLERDRLLARWADLTIRLLDAERIDAATAADRALSFGLLDEDILRRIADALETAGHTAQAAMLIAALDDGRHLGP